MHIFQSHTAYYVRVEEEAIIDDLAKYMSKVWKKRNPDIILSVISSLSHYKKWKNGQEVEDFQAGLIQVRLRWDTGEMWTSCWWDSGKMQIRLTVNIIYLACTIFWGKWFFNKLVWIWIGVFPNVLILIHTGIWKALSDVLEIAEAAFHQTN